MPPTRTTEGLDAARVIREDLPDTAILVLSSPREGRAGDRAAGQRQRSGHLLKDRVGDVEDFLVTRCRIIMGPRSSTPLSCRNCSPREREVLALMAEGRSNSGIGRQLWVSEGTVEKHVRSILMKLRIAEASVDHRRVLAVLTFLDSP